LYNSDTNRQFDIITITPSSQIEYESQTSTDSPLSNQANIITNQ
jgi:hypothetical protein